MSRVLSTIALALAALLALPSLAAARGPDGAYLVLDRLEASEDADAVIVDITIAHDSWEWAQRNRVAPTALVTVILDRGRHEDQRVELRRASERVRVAVPRGARILGAEISFGGGSREHAIGWFRIGGVDLITARLRVAPLSVLHGGGGGGGSHIGGGHGGHDGGGGGGGHGGGHGGATWNRDPAVIAACGEATSSQSACLERVATARFDPTSMISACSAAFRPYDSDVVQCLGEAAAADSEPSALVASCKRAFGAYGSDVHGCIVEGTQVKRERAAAGVVDACKRAFGAYGSDVHQCIREAGPARFDGSGMIDACKRAFGAYGSDVHQCTTEMVHARFEPSATIDACKGLFGAYGSDVHKCLTTASGAARDPSAVVRACGGSAYASDKHSCVATAVR